MGKWQKEMFPRHLWVIPAFTWPSQYGDLWRQHRGEKVPLGGRGVREDRDNCCVLGIGGELNELPQGSLWLPEGAEVEGQPWGKEGAEEQVWERVLCSRSSVACVLIKSAPCLLGSGGSSDTMNYSPRPAAPALTCRGSHN